jgi:hypothetical protein
MLFGVNRATRVSAAETLVASEPVVVVKAMLAEIDHANSADTVTDSQPQRLLMEFGQAPAIDHLKGRLVHFSASERAGIVTSLSVGQPTRVFGATRYAFAHAELAKRRRAVENLLAKELNDTARLMGTSMGIDSRHFQNPRLCELASFELARLIGPPYRSYETRTDAEGDSLRAANLNVWRVRQGLKATK